jgi:hypothetical protein
MAEKLENQLSKLRQNYQQTAKQRIPSLARVNDSAIATTR